MKQNKQHSCGNCKRIVMSDVPDTRFFDAVESWQVIRTLPMTTRVFGVEKEYYIVEYCFDPIPPGVGKIKEQERLRRVARRLLERAEA